MKTTKLAQDLLDRGKKQLGEDVALTPLDFLLQTMWDVTKTFDARFDAAKTAAPYCHPRLSSVQVSSPDDNKITIVFRDLSKPPKQGTISGQPNAALTAPDETPLVIRSPEWATMTGEAPIVDSDVDSSATESTEVHEKV